MRRLAALVLLVSTSALAQSAPPREELAAHIRFLADDLLEGRGIGTRGGRLAELYIETVFRAAGLAPAFGDGYRQEIALRRVEPDAGMKVSFTGTSPVTARFGEDVVAVLPYPAEEHRVAADLVFAGFGVAAPEFGWDDFKDVDVRGKMLLVLAGEPGGDDPALFEGPALTYYGRWTYKYEEAARRGAAGVLLIHSDAGAGYDWTVVRNSWSGAAFFDEDRADLLRFQGWVTGALARALVAGPDRDLDRLRAAAATRAFRPVAIGRRIEATVRSTYSTVRTANVAGIVRGSAPAAERRAIVLSAHHDHLGTAEIDGKSVTFNGAVDNGSALAVLLGLARAYAAQPAALRADLVFLACAAEEEGLIGSDVFARNPPLPRERIVAAVNFEMTNVWGEARDVLAIGARYSELGDLVEQVAGARGLAVAQESSPEQGYFFRSDQVSFARAGIPAIWLDMGEELREEPGLGRRLRRAYRTETYHRPADRFDERWPLAGTRQLAALAIDLLAAIDRRGLDLGWKPGAPFRRGRTPARTSARAGQALER